MSDAAIVDELGSEIAMMLAKGTEVRLGELGRFTVRSFQGYDTVDARTGQPPGVRPRRLPFFKTGTALKAFTNGERSELPTVDSPELIRRVSQRTGVPADAAARVLEAWVHGVLRQLLQPGEPHEIAFGRLGVFTLRRKPETRNPMVPSGRVLTQLPVTIVVFQPSDELKKALNGSP